jgi:hypothetical protein
MLYCFSSPGIPLHTHPLSGITTSLPQSLCMTNLGSPCSKGNLLEEKHHTSLSTRVDILHHVKLVSKVLILYSRQRLGENARYLLIYGYVLELHYSSLHRVLDVMVFDLYMLQIVMKDKII